MTPKAIEDNMQKVLAELARYITDNAPDGLIDAERIRNKEAHYLRFHRFYVGKDQQWNLEVGLDIEAVLTSRNKTDDAGNSWCTYGLVVHIYQPYVGRAPLAVSEKRLEYMMEVLKFGKELEKEFSDIPLNCIFETKAEREAREEAQTKENLGGILKKLDLLKGIRINGVVELKRDLYEKELEGFNGIYEDICVDDRIYTVGLHTSKIVIRRAVRNEK